MANTIFKNKCVYWSRGNPRPMSFGLFSFFQVVELGCPPILAHTEATCFLVSDLIPLKSSSYFGVCLHCNFYGTLEAPGQSVLCSFVFQSSWPKSLFILYLSRTKSPKFLEHGDQRLWIYTCLLRVSSGDMHGQTCDSNMLKRPAHVPTMTKQFVRSDGNPFQEYCGPRNAGKHNSARPAESHFPKC